ncbi:MAG TPA: hypothetical protein VHV56_05110, partial [Pseudolabrys sp.]|nr:hypothetical protein [Pseudolabrys sp.]
SSIQCEHEVHRAAFARALSHAPMSRFVCDLSQWPQQPLGRGLTAALPFFRYAHRQSLKV